MREKTTALVLFAVLGFYSVTIGWRGVELVRDGRPAAVLLGLAVIALPLVLFAAMWPLLAMARAMIADPSKGGTYHFAGAPDVSWADFAREIFARSGLSPQVVDIPTSAYPTPARRPLNSRLDCSAISRDFGIPRPDWREGLDRVIQELSA